MQEDPFGLRNLNRQHHDNPQKELDEGVGAFNKTVVGGAVGLGMLGIFQSMAGLLRR